MWKPAIDLRDIDKSQYFAITEFNNCFIIRSPFFWSTKYVKPLCFKPFSYKYVKSLCLLGGVVSITHAQNICWLQNTYLKEVIFSSRGELSANEKGGKNTSNDNYFFWRVSLCFAHNNILFVYFCFLFLNSYNLRKIYLSLPKLSLSLFIIQWPFISCHA